MRAKPRGLADVLFGKSRGAILALLYERPEQSFYYRQLTREVNGVSPGTLQRELSTLSQIGLIIRSTLGNQVFYQANRSHPLFPELRGLLAKTLGAIPRLRSALSQLAGSISLAFVYGSVAREEERAESDIDLMIVGSVALEDILRAVHPTEVSLQRSINPTLYSAAEFKRKLAAGNHYLSSVVRGDKIFLIGDGDDLRKVGGLRLAESPADQQG
jgi:predicted nucleotidyltransferase